MLANAMRFGAGAALAALVFLSWREPVERCWPLDTNPGAWACVGNARPDAAVRPVEAAPARGAAEAELTDGFRRAVLEAAGERLPTPNARLPLPTWLPAGVLGWEAEIHEAAARVDLDPLALAILVSIECPSGNPRCLSSVGARGLTQVMPKTARHIQDATGLPCADNPFDGATSLRCGAWYLRECMRLGSALWAPGREAETIGAAGIGYNAGPGRIAGVVAHVKGGGAACAAPPPDDFSLENWQQPLSWCRQALDMWRRAGRN